MQRNLFFYTSAAILGIGASLSACAPSVSLSDLSRPGYRMNPHPAVDLDPPYVRTPYSFGSQSYGSQQPCLMSNPRCTPDLQLQWAEANQR